MTIPAWVKGTLLLGITLGAGVAIGVSYERSRSPAHDAAGMDSHNMIHHLKEELGLDSAQEKAVAAIFARRQRTVDSTWRAIRPHMHAALDSTLQEIQGVLKVDQVAKYRTMVKAHHPGALR